MGARGREEGGRAGGQGGYPLCVDVVLASCSRSCVLVCVCACACACVCASSGCLSKLLLEPPARAGQGVARALLNHACAVGLARVRVPCVRLPGVGCVAFTREYM